eukprot:scaffold942_cov260-Pinguiococcus_pyrenoidosus.AAC.3
MAHHSTDETWERPVWPNQMVRRPFYHRQQKLVGQPTLLLSRVVVQLGMLREEGELHHVQQARGRGRHVQHDFVVFSRLSAETRHGLLHLRSPSL